MGQLSIQGCKLQPSEAAKRPAACAGELAAWLGEGRQSRTMCTDAACPNPFFARLRTCVVAVAALSTETAQSGSASAVALSSAPLVRAAHNMADVTVRLVLFS